MSLYKRKDSKMFWYKFTVNGKTLSGSTGTDVKAKAQEFHDRLKVQLWEQSKLGVKPVRTWQETVLRYIEETKDKRTHQQDIDKFKWLHVYLGHLALKDITVAVLDEIRQAKLIGNTKSTVNRYLSLIRAVLNKAVEWEFIDSFKPIKMYSEPAGRVRQLTVQEVHKLLGELPEWLRDMVIFSIASGLRFSNCQELEWSKVVLPKRHMWVDTLESKTRKAIAVPLNETAYAVLVKQVGKHPTRVFTCEGQPAKYANRRIWRAALKRAGITDFRWHDLRHCWASFSVQNGVSLLELQKLGGWASMRMVERYAHLSSEHLLDASKKLDKVGISYVSATVPVQDSEAEAL